MDQSGSFKTQVTRSEWFHSLAKYEKPSNKKAWGQVVNTLIPYSALWALMVWMLSAGYSYWMLTPLILINAGLLVRIFIFFHDCGHGCFFPSRNTNKYVGYITGIMTFTPFKEWRHSHSLHHAKVADLDNRGEGDIWTLTVDEFNAKPPMTKLAYRLYRNPLILFVFGPPLLFMIFQRIPYKSISADERRSVHIANAGVLGALLLAHFTIGLRAYCMIQIPVMSLAACVGTWMFYVQHQYEGVYWARHENWDPIRAALEGSSYYKLPKVLQWFSGNIGLHHIHHLRPRIPNYNLQLAYDETPEMHIDKPLTLAKSWNCMFLNLWDESNQQLISFRKLRVMRRRAAVLNRA